MSTTCRVCGEPTDGSSHCDIHLREAIDNIFARLGPEPKRFDGTPPAIEMEGGGPDENPAAALARVWLQGLSEIVEDRVYRFALAPLATLVDIDDAAATQLGELIHRAGRGDASGFA